MCIKNVLWNLIPTCWMAAKFGNARAFCCFTPSAKSCIQFLNVRKNCRSFKMPDWNIQNFESHSATVLCFFLFFFHNSLGSELKTLALNILKFSVANFQVSNCIFLYKSVFVKYKPNGCFLTFRNLCRRQRGQSTGGWIGGICGSSVLGRVLCH